MKKLCSYCKNPFQAQRISRLYCSDNCKQMAYYKRHDIIPGGSNIGVNPVLGELNVKEKDYANNASFVIRLNAFIEEEVAKRVADAVERITKANQKEVIVNTNVKPSRNVKPNFTVSRNLKDQSEIEAEEGEDTKDCSYECENQEGNETNVKGQDNVKPNFMVNHYRKAQSLIEEEQEANEEANKAQGNEFNNDSGRKSDEVKSHFTSSLSKHQSIGEIEESDEDTVERDDQENSDHNVLELDNVKSLFTVSAEKLADDHDGIDISPKSFSARKSVIAKKQHIELSSFTVDNVKHQTATTANDKDKWVYSTFTGFIHESVFPDYSGINDSNGQTVLQVFKCLVKHLLFLSNRETITRHNLCVLANLFTKLTLSDSFKYLDKSRFPHYHTIISLAKKIQSLEKLSHKQDVHLRFTLKYRAELYAILYGMEDKIKDIRIKDIRFMKVEHAKSLKTS